MTQLCKEVKTGNLWEDEKENRCSYSITSSFHYACNSPAGTQFFLGFGAYHRPSSWHPHRQTRS